MITVIIPCGQITAAMKIKTEIWDWKADKAETETMKEAAAVYAAVIFSISNGRMFRLDNCKMETIFIY